MKSIIAVISLLVPLFLLTAAPARSEEVPGAYFKAGPVQFTYPLANASAIALYDFWKGEGLIGMEMSVAQAWGCINVNFGAVGSFQANGMPFVSLDYKMDDLARLPSRLGLWYGHDFKTNDNRAGIKASVPLW